MRQYWRSSCETNTCSTDVLSIPEKTFAMCQSNRSTERDEQTQGANPTPEEKRPEPNSRLPRTRRIVVARFKWWANRGEQGMISRGWMDRVEDMRRCVSRSILERAALRIRDLGQARLRQFAMNRVSVRGSHRTWTSLVSLALTYAICSKRVASRMVMCIPNVRERGSWTASRNGTKSNCRPR